MEIFLSTILGEVVSRSINFFVSKSTKATELDVEEGLQRDLLRAQVIVDEAMERHITNQAVLRQLDMLRDAMHHGCYILDTFRYKPDDEEEAKDQVVSHSLALCKLNSLKAICYSNRNTLLLEQLKEAHDNLSTMIVDVKELVVFLASYPRLYTQPYCMHILLGNCMFGRQTETEFVINFLLHTQPHASEKLEVLPIVGPVKVGKSTLVAHVCGNERVRDHFTEILFLRDHDFADEHLSTLREGCAIKHQNRILNSNKDGRLLVVVDLVGDLSEDAWNMLYCCCKQSMASGSKIILTSQSDKIIKFGTTRALSLKYLSNEAIWYLFKTLTFGSMDPNIHPRFAHLAMEIAKMLPACLVTANIYASLLRDNFDIHFWRKVLAFLKQLVHKHVSKFGVHPFEQINQNRPLHLGRMAIPFEDFVFYHEHQSSPQEELPKISVPDILHGSVKAIGKLEAIAWTSRIPPYYSFVVTCEVLELKSRAPKRKRTTRKGSGPC